MEEVWGNRRLAMCRELTKLHEEFFRGTVEQARQHLLEKSAPGGICPGGGTGGSGPGRAPGGDPLDEVSRLMERAWTKTALAQAAKTYKVPKRELYTIDW